MRVFIPTINTKLQLDQPWSFLLYQESRNQNFLDLLRPVIGDLPTVPVTPYIDHVYNEDLWFLEYVEYTEPQRRYDPRYVSSAPQFTLPAGSIVAVDRIYVRQKAADFDSVTFKLLSTTHPALMPYRRQEPFAKSGRKIIARFWAKLDDVNTMDVSIIPELRLVVGGNDGSENQTV